MKRTKFSRKVIGYIRVSTIDQDTQKNEAAIYKFANSNDFGKVEIWASDFNLTIQIGEPKGQQGFVVEENVVK